MFKFVVNKARELICFNCIYGDIPSYVGIIFGIAPNPSPSSPIEIKDNFSNLSYHIEPLLVVQNNKRNKLVKI